MRYITPALLCLCGMLAATAAPVSPADAAYQVTLRQAVPADAKDKARDLQLLLDVRGGAVVGAIGYAPTFNTMIATVDAAKLAVVDGKLAGPLKVSIPWDGYVPKDGKPYVAEYALDIAAVDGVLTGAWTSGAATGTVVGGYGARPSDAGVVRLTLRCENAMDFGEKLGSRRTSLVITLKDGKAVSARAIPRGSIADVGCSMETPNFDVALKDGKVAGTVEVAVTPQSISALNPVRTYVYTIDGLVIGDTVSGTLATTVDGKPVKDVGLFVGPVRRGALPAPGACTYKLTLNHALGTGKFIDVYMSSTNGKLTGGFASSPNFNNAMHLVDLSKLALKDDTLTGDLGITVLADPWVPADHKPVACAFAIDARIADGDVAGTFAGTAGATKVAEKLNGSLDDKVKLENITGMTIRLENGLAGSGNHMARAFVGIAIKDGKIVGGSVSNNHDGNMKGTVTGGTFTMDGDQWKMRVEFTLTSAGSAALGKYVTTAEGTFVGTMSAGAFTCTHEAGRVKDGSFWAALKIGN